MKVGRVLVFLTCVASIRGFEFIFKPGPLTPATEGEIWPKPQYEDRVDGKFFVLSPLFFNFKVTGRTCMTLLDALTRYKRLIINNSRLVKEVYYPIRTCNEPSNPNSLGYLSKLEVLLTGPCLDSEYPSFEMEEEYVLNVTSQVQQLSSNSLWGILRGLESFSQLIYLTDDGACHQVKATNIHDFPRLRHRGLSLDTSRHYHKKEDILRYLDAMSYSKFNVFHWHITDDYSFPYESITFPELSEKGSFNSKLWVYDQKFVKEVQEYARKRGIRVLMEFDTPGHTLSWGLSHPELLTQCYNVPSLVQGPLDPTKESTYTLIFKLLDEIKTVFRDEYTHLGGDEVDYACWRSNPDITKFMAERGISGDYTALQSYYIKRVIDHATALNLSLIVWEEVFTNGVQLPESTLIQVWIRDDPAQVLSEVTAAGHRAIISAYWYLDQLNTGGDWLKYYNVDPLDFPGTEEQKKLVIGAEAAMWSEVLNTYNLEPRVWPRACAAAEKFWSAPALALDFEQSFVLAQRLQEHTCRLNRRDIKAQPPSGPSVCY